MARIILMLLLFSLGSCAQRTENSKNRSTTKHPRATGQDLEKDVADKGEEESEEESEDSLDGEEDDDSQLGDIDIGGDNVVLNYANIVGPLMLDACVSCHAPGGQASFLSLDTKELLEAAIGNDPDPVTNLFFARLNDDENPMPPNANRQQRDALIKVFMDWQASGFE